MKHHVTPQTALKLKEAGYPQPDIVHGFWAINNETPIYDPYQWHLDKLAYMPTATEIMEQPEMLDCVICYYVGGWRVMDLDAVSWVDNENPAEAAAELYLKIKQQ